MGNRYIHLFVTKTSFRKLMSSRKLHGYLLYTGYVKKNFLGNRKAPNSETLVSKMISGFRNLECNVSIKVHFLYSHLDKFPENLEAVSDEQGKHFHQDLMTKKEWKDYFWGIKRDCPLKAYKR